MKYWVYEHIFPNGKRYIGLTTKNNPKQRWSGGSAYKGQFVFKAIQKYGWKNGYNITPGGDYTVSPSICTTVYQYSPTGKLLNRFNSIADAARFVSTNPTNISGVNANSIAQTKHSRRSQSSSNRPHPSWKWGEIEQYDLSGRLIKTYHSAKQAEIETGIANSNIYKVCNGQRKMAGGFVWKNK